MQCEGNIQSKISSNVQCENGQHFYTDRPQAYSFCNFRLSTESFRIDNIPCIHWILVLQVGSIFYRISNILEKNAFILVLGTVKIKFHKLHLQKVFRDGAALVLVCSLIILVVMHRPR